MPISVASPRNAARLAPPLRALLSTTLALEDARPGEIAIVLSGDAELRALNRRWRGIDRATDVLSFEYGDAPSERNGAEGGEMGTDPRHGAAAGRPGRPATSPRSAPSRRPATISGDLVISLDRVRAQARRYRVSEGRELARLVVHGALHLAGHDHARARERDVMRAQERRALRAAGPEVTKLDAALRGAR
jgi:probable rRNA maturation factor